MTSGATTHAAKSRADAAAAQRDSVLAKAHDTQGLVRSKLYPHSDAIQLVTYDGEYLGSIRLAGGPARQASWVAVPEGQLMTAGTFHSPKAAAKALGLAADKAV
ncbi:hypothetical protein K7472_31115 [Streptomyces sp. PTM05]|uniref:Uncharacterized protein n=1 Tax=Streptantibioticus parmotrematis TaxID=2873249 RepID=A0ABS7R2V7_9ACTN|nr:hypothetical protein [Streptantibioticus parmotrematis]MBY8889261.1 hypothetical protein [Streptantibioticus parmotrematis]